ncbi:uncharacterized protein TRIADDRAFT_20587 [Trichoplax adhaerens]|uniref:Choline/carnitine acyltransferase domain-containing protein n=1 Tax=Trichoplax adhaerens TaxID=10228 RepID=B3RP88_TRIAD|nr:hypothetical protein TRIADDRAFT_20587 [Trichoplax adhaerens]EDV28147.1 hypothetical protein TRIADDRAFT_20587 [Trichoplax adhaerens]|eukprot:XP_002109981.1 hypothetical protein TRIADDRAFT_20587 [Trichoplax adhaerens]
MKTKLYHQQRLLPVITAARGFLTHQSSLPHLPVPPLKDTLDRYLLSIKPLLTSVEFENTKKIVEKFGESGGIGHTLNEKLKERAKQHNNWLAEWWLNYAYLEYRAPNIVNSNPAIIFPKFNFSGLEGQLEYVVQNILLHIDYLEVDTAGKRPMCMIQHTNIFGSCRVPKPKRDAFYTHPYGNPPCNHIIVIYNNQIFAVDVMRNGQKISAEQIHQQLKLVVASTPQPVESIGILTSNDRDSWAEAYAHLAQDPINKDNLETIKTALFAICIDRPGISYSGNADGKEYMQYFRNYHSRMLLHGEGSLFNSGNRWFDKTIELIIGPDGLIGANYEHSAGEGPPVVTALDHVCNYCMNNRLSTNENINPESLPTVRPLHWLITHQTRNDILQATTKINKLAKDVDLRAIVFDAFGANLVRSYKLSPDGFFQIAMQLAYYRLHGRSPPTYESGGTRQYILGRTETIRSATIESDTFARAIDWPSYSNQERRELMLAALNRHKDVTIKAITGHGWDRHLLGMKLIAMEQGLEVPELHKDVGYTKSTRILLSTSQVSSNCDLSLFFGPTAPDCYGVCYSPNPNNYRYSCSTFNSCPDTNGKLFAELVSKSLLDMQALLLTKPKL